MRIVHGAALAATAVGAGVVAHQIATGNDSARTAGVYGGVALGAAGLMAMATRIGFRFVVVPSVFLHPPTLLSRAGGFAAAGAAGALAGAALARD